jgi:hypothetical protein
VEKQRNPYQHHAPQLLIITIQPMKSTTYIARSMSSESFFWNAKYILLVNFITSSTVSSLFALITTPNSFSIWGKVFLMTPHSVRCAGLPGDCGDCSRYLQHESRRFQEFNLNNFPIIFSLPPCDI